MSNQQGKNEFLCRQASALEQQLQGDEKHSIASASVKAGDVVISAEACFHGGADKAHAVELTIVDLAGQDGPTVTKLDKLQIIAALSLLEAVGLLEATQAGKGPTDALKREYNKMEGIN